jgi:CDP-4-dehydro-6-deoxyglucose reductase
MEYTVRIEPHGRTIRVRSDQPVLEAALGAGLNLPHSCKSGHCASCRARLVSGEIHYPNGRTAGLTAQEAQQGYVLLCQARARSDLRVEVRIIANASEAEIKTLPCRIARMERLAPDVMQVFLRLPAVERLQFQAGQYLDVLLEGGRRRSFSIASPPHDSEQIELHARRVPGGGFTGALFESLRVGSLLRIEGPIGQFIYRESAAPALLIAGGTGFAPIKSILRHALERGSAREFHFYWGAREAGDMYQADLVREWTRQFPQLRFTPVLSEAGAAARVIEGGEGGGPGEISEVGRGGRRDEISEGGERGAAGMGVRTGWVHEAVLADFPSLAAFDVYAAGPPAMVEAIRASFPSRGVSEDRLHFDSFDYAHDSSG